MSKPDRIDRLRAAARLAEDARHVVAGAKKDGGGQRAPVEAADSLRSSQTAQVLDLLSEGEIGGLVNGERSIYLDGVPLKAADGSYNFKDVAVAWTYGTQGQAALPDLSGVQTEVAVGVAVPLAAPVVRTVTNLNVDTVRVTIAVPQISSSDPSTGDINGSTFTWAVDVQASGGGYVEVFQDTVTGKKMSTYKRARKFPLTGTGPWNVRVRRISADSGSAGVVNAFLWDTYTEIQSLKLRYPNSAMVLLSVNAQHFNRIPQRAYDILGVRVRVPSNYNPLTRVYTGVWDGTFQVAWTDNPAWIFLELVSNERWGLGGWLQQAGLNAETAKWQLYTISQYCDGMVSDGYGGLEPRFTCNAYIQTREQALQVVQHFAAIFRGAAFWASGELHVTQDAPSDPVALFAAANVVGGRFSYQTGSDKQRHSVFIVYWNDITQLGRRVPEVWAPDHLVARFGLKEIEVEPIGLTRRGQAMRLARWMAYTEEHEGRVVAFKVGAQGELVLPGQVFQIADPSEAGERLGGRIRTATASQVTLDAPVTLLAGETYTLTVQLPDPDNPAALVTEQRAVTNAAGTTSVLDLAAPYGQVPAAQAVWVLQSNNIAATTWRCLTCRESDDGTEYEITALAHDPAKFAAVEQGIVLEPRQVTRLGTQVKPPLSVTLTPQLYQDGQTWRIKLLVSWVPSAAGLQHIVSWRMAQGSWVTLAQTVDQAVDIPGLDAGTVQVEVRAVNALGTVSVPTTASTAVQGNTVPAANVAGLAYSLDTLGALITWTASTDFDWTETELRLGSDWNTATLLARVRATSYRFGWPPNATYAVLVRHRRRSGPDGAISAINVTVTTKQLLADALEGLVGSAQIAAGSVTASKLAAQAVDATKFANGLRPVEIVATLPTTGNFEGRTAYLTTDDKLYRHNGTDWVSTVPAADITGQVTAPQIAAGAVDASKLAVEIGGGNLLSNSSFELDTNADGLADSWGSYVTSGSPTISLVTNAGSVRYGARAQRLDHASLPTNEAIGVFQTNDGAFAGKNVTASVWMSTNAGRRLVAYLEWYNSANVFISANTVANVAATGQLQRVSGTVAAPAGAARVRVYLYSMNIGAATGTTVDIDGAQLEFGDVATAYAPRPDEILPGAVVSTAIADGAVSAIKTSIAAINAATGALNTNTVDAVQIVANAVTALKIAAGAVTAAKTTIAAIDPGTGNLTANSVTATQIAAGAVTAGKIAADAITANEIAANAVGVNELAAGSVTAGKIAAGAVITEKIATNAITANELAADSVTTNKIAANAVVASRIAAGSVGATHIAANAVTTDKLLVTGRGAALNDDPAFQDPSAWLLRGGTTGTFVTIADGSAGTTALQSGSGGGSWYNSAKTIPVDPSKTYRVRCRARNLASATGNGVLYIGTALFDASGVDITGDGSQWFYGAANGVSPPTAWTVYSASFGAGTARPFPSNGRTMAAVVILNFGGTTGNMQAQDLRIEEMTGADLIVDGTITAQKIAANAVTANALAADSVTTNKIAAEAVVASRIAANAVTTGKIAAGAVTAAQIAAGAITTDKLLVTGRGRALNDDPQCSDISAWGTGTGSVAVTTGAGAPVGTTVLRATDGTQIFSRQFAVEAGKNYKVSLWARQVSGGGVMYVRLYCYNAAGTLVSYVVTGITPTSGSMEGLTVPGTWTRYSGFIVPGSGSVYAQVYLHVNWATTGVTDVTDVRCEEYVGADLIVDGSITASKINSNGLDIRDVNGNVVFASGSAGPNLSTAGAVVLVASAGMQVLGASATKVSGGDGWDGSVRSVDGYVGGAFVSAVIAQTDKHLMLGLNTDPAADNSYSSLDYAWYPVADGSLRIYESGTDIGSFGTYAAGDVLSITYDGTAARYWRNGTLHRTVTVTITQALYLDTSFHGVNGRLNNIRFGPYGNPSAVQGSNPITSGNVSTYIASAAIQDAQIANLNAAKITAGTLDAARIAAGSLNADRITAGTITTDRLILGSVTANVTAFASLSSIGTLPSSGVYTNGPVNLVSITKQQGVIKFDGHLTFRLVIVSTFAGTEVEMSVSFDVSPDPAGDTSILSFVRRVPVYTDAGGFKAVDLSVPFAHVIPSSAANGTYTFRATFQAAGRSSSGASVNFGSGGSFNFAVCSFEANAQEAKV
jgi:predicted phage tail protein